MGEVQWGESPLRKCYILWRLNNAIMRMHLEDRFIWLDEHLRDRIQRLKRENPKPPLDRTG